jgi:hypothetical protein
MEPGRRSRGDRMPQGWGYPEPVLTAPSIVRLRRRLPLIVFILLAILCLVVIGFACACFSDHPAQAIDRAVSAPAAMPAVIEVWSLVILSLSAPLLVLTRRVDGSARASPAQLQRFLF